jgi:hypothetical protein
VDIAVSEPNRLEDIEKEAGGRPDVSVKTARRDNDRNLKGNVQNGKGAGLYD